MRVFEIVDQVEALEKTTGTFFVGRLLGFSYDDLVGILGQPTFPRASSDDKVQKEWVIEFNDNIYTIYDWCTYIEDYTMNNLKDWNIGGFTSIDTDELINYLKDAKTKNIHRASETA
jgi:hypothetical protein